jgi:hypothetical protein
MVIYYIIKDQSVLEHFHVSEAFKLILNNKDCDIFSNLNRDEYKICRKRIIECVLATDMTLHTKEFNYLKVKLETYSIKQGKNIEKLFDNLDHIALYNTQQEFLNILIHSADISNPTKPLHIFQTWVANVLEEFWLQGDKEKDMCLPISFLCDRKTTNVETSQLGFIEGIVYPLFQSLVEFFPGLNWLIDNLNSNKAYYKKLKEEEEKNKKVESLKK